MKIKNAALAEKLWNIGLAAKVKEQGYDQCARWEDLDAGNWKAWEAVAAFVKNVERRSTPSKKKQRKSSLS